eukprot:1456711-Amphidinium_carterae.1
MVTSSKRDEQPALDKLSKGWGLRCQERLGIKLLRRTLQHPPLQYELELLRITNALSITENSERRVSQQLRSFLPLKPPQQHAQKRARDLARPTELSVAIEDQS